MKFDHAKSRLSEDDLVRIASPLAGYAGELAHICGGDGANERHESSLNLPDDTRLREDIEYVYRETCTDSLKYVIVVGIGGSNLGAKAVYDAVRGPDDRSEDDPQVIFADTTDVRTLFKVTGLIEDAESACDVLVVIVTKSGTTTETIANAEIILNALKARFGKAAFEQCVVISDAGSALSAFAEEKAIRTLSIPPAIGGRFSIFSAAGLFPLFAAGIDIDALRAGAFEMTALCVAADPHKNPALASASVLFHAYKEGKGTNVNFVFNPELESLGKWYRQLLGESIGKKEDVNGKVIRAGITPEVSVGSVDMHSVGQLYFGGPQDKITTFIRAETREESIPVPKDRVFPRLVPEIAGKSADDVLNAIYEGVLRAYEHEEMPFTEVRLAHISPYEIGQFMQFKMAEIMYLGKLFNVNPFDQPGVEAYKTETHRILEGKN